MWDKVAQVNKKTQAKMQLFKLKTASVSEKENMSYMAILFYPVKNNFNIICDWEVQHNFQQLKKPVGIQL